MNVSSIAAASSAQSMQMLQNQVATKVTRMTYDAQKAHAQQILSMMEEVIQIAGLTSVSGKPTMPGIGAAIDVTG